MVPPTSDHSSSWPGPESEEASSPAVAEGTETGAVIVGAGNGHATTAVCTDAPLLSDTGSMPLSSTVALLVRVAGTDGVATIATVATAFGAMSPRSQFTPNVTSVQEPWLGVADWMLALIVSPSTTWTAVAPAGPWFVIVSV